MSFEETHSDVTQEVAPTPDTTELTMVCEAPSHQDVLPDGREVIVIGDPQGDARFNHLQGDNNEGFLGTCGCVSCEDVLGQFGVTVRRSLMRPLNQARNASRPRRATLVAPVASSRAKAPSMPAACNSVNARSFGGRLSLSSLSICRSMPSSRSISLGSRAPLVAVFCALRPKAAGLRGSRRRSGVSAAAAAAS